MTVSNIDRNTCRIIRERINATLATLGEELGLDISAGNATMDRQGRNATFKLAVAVVNADTGVVLSKEATDFERYQFQHGLPADLVGQTLTVMGERYTIEGYRPKSRKYPVVARRADGKGFKLPVSAVKFAVQEAA